MVHPVALEVALFRTRPPRTMAAAQAAATLVPFEVLAVVQLLVLALSESFTPHLA